MTTSARTDVLIGGAGPTGLALACDLARRGVQVRIVERGRGLFPGSRGKGLSQRLLEVFDDLGVVHDVLAGARTHMQVTNYDRDRVLFTADSDAGIEPTPDIPYPSAAWAPQWRTQEILRTRLAGLGVEVEFGCEVADVSQDDDGVTCTLARDGGQEQVRARYLIGCDGGRSTIRKRLGLTFEGLTRQDHRHAFVGDVQVDGLMADRSHGWNDPRLGFLLLTPFTDTPVWQFQALLRTDARPDAPEPSLTTFQGIADEITGGLPIRLSGLTWASRFTTSERIAERYRTGRVFLAGDAAHVYSPAGGQGMTTGIQDAYNLAWKLAAVLDGAPDSLLDTYEAERRPIAQRALIDSGHRFDEVLTTTEDPHADPRQLWKTVINRKTSQLGITYRGGPLAPETEPGTTTLWPGDRAPDSICSDPDSGTDIRLFDLFRGPHWTVLTFADIDTANAPTQLHGSEVRTWVIDDRAQGALRDKGNTARAAYGVTGPTTFLIRPDGYVGAIATTGDANTVLDMFRRLPSGPPQPIASPIRRGNGFTR
jgi:2-polyprenyl-6-methoxyphenol hydroxylase-like FAD-dependent oxidoreductase